MTTCPVPPQPSNRRPNFSLGWCFIINVEWDNVIWYGPDKGWVGHPAGTGQRSFSTTSPNLSRRGVSDALTRVGTTASLLITNPVDKMVSPVESPSKTQYTPLQPLLCGVYLPPATLILTFSVCVPRSGCNTDGDSDPLSRQSSLMTQPTSILA